MNMTKLLNNWKTTSAGVTMISGAVVHLVFACKNGTSNENTWTITIVAVVGGLGLIFAGDASGSTPVAPPPANTENTTTKETKP